MCAILVSIFFALLVYIVLATYVIEHVFHYNNNYIYILIVLQTHATVIISVGNANQMALLNTFFDEHNIIDFGFHLKQSTQQSCTF